MTLQNAVSRTSISIDFPLSEGTPETALKGQVEILQTSTGHDVVMIRYTGTIEYLNFKYRTGAPVKITWNNRYGSSTFVGYVHHLRPVFDTDMVKTDIVCIGASFSMLKTQQRSWQDMTASGIVKQIVEEHGLEPIVEFHPRIYKNFNQTGNSDWSVLRTLSKDTGYVLNCDETSVYFVSRQKFREHFKPMAQTFNYMRGGPMGYRMSDVFSFKPIVGDYTPESGGINAERTTFSYDSSNGESYKTIGKLDTFASKRSMFSTPSLRVSSTPAEAEAILAGKLEENRFVHRATALTVGSPAVAPERLVYLKGVPHPYGGYWTVLKVKHVLRDPANYLMELELGSDGVVGETEPPPDDYLSAEKKGSPILRVIPEDPSNPLSMKRASSKLLDYQIVKGYTGQPLDYARWYASTAQEMQ